MYKLFLLLTTLLAVTHRTTVADVTGVTIDEFATPAGSLSTAANALKPSIDDDSDADETQTAKTGLVLTGGSGTGAVVTIVGKAASATGIETVTVTCGGSGYKVGDTLTIVKAQLASDVDVTFVLVSDDLVTTPEGSLKSSSLVTFANTVAQSATELFEATTNTRAGTSAIVGVKGDATTASNNALRFTTCGSGYRPGDKLTIATTNLAGGSSAIVITIQKENIEGYVKRIPTLGGYRTVEGAPFNSNGNFAANTEFTGYYVALKKTTTHVQVTAAFSTAGTLTASLGATTDSAITDGVPSETFFAVADGLNIFKVVSSLDGTYEFNLMKPDDEVKHLVGASSKRSIAIAYNPASVGEFICSAFANDATPPTTRENVKSDGVAKSVRTHNIVPENMFSSLQMSLNGLEPNIEYDIYCHHLFHGIISNTANTVVTDKGSLTGVSLVPSGGTGLGAGTYTTLTLTFTHEITLVADNTIVLTLYDNYDEKQTVSSSGTAGAGGCGDSISATSGGVAIAGVEECETADDPDGGTDNFYPLTLKLKGTSTVASGTRGTEVVFTLSDDGSELDLAANAAAGTIVTFDLEVEGHGKLQQQYGWTTS